MESYLEYFNSENSDLITDYSTSSADHPTSCTGYNTYPLTPAFDLRKLVTNTPSNANQNEFIDVSLDVPWSLIQIDDMLWTARIDGSTVAGYSINGKPITSFSVHTIQGYPGQPSALVFNPDPSKFIISKGPIKLSSTIVVATRTGMIMGYNKNLDLRCAFLLRDESLSNRMFLGACLSDIGYLHLVDFSNNEIITLDGNLEFVSGMDQDNFRDRDMINPIPINFRANNIQQVNDDIFVTYAESSAIVVNGRYEQPGYGKGYISRFTKTGKFISRFASNGPLDIPWSIIACPYGWGYPSGCILVGCAGSGCILVYHNNGVCLGYVQDRCAAPYSLGYVRGLVSWNRTSAQINNSNLVFNNDLLFYCISRNYLRESEIGVIYPSKLI